MPSHAIARSVSAQYDRVWGSMAKAIDNCPDDQWRAADVDWLMPARLAYHAIEACDLYCRDDLRGFVLNPLGPGGLSANGPPWCEDTPGPQLPTRDALRGYLEVAAARIRTWLLGLSDEAMLADQQQFTHTGRTILERTIYTLRHMQHHLGQTNAELRRRSLTPAEWD